MAIQALSKPTNNIRSDHPSSKHNAGRIQARASTFKLQTLNDRYGDIGVAIPCLAPPSPSPSPSPVPSLSHPRPASPSTSQETHPAPPRLTLFYLTLRKKAMDNTLTNLKYIISPPDPCISYETPTCSSHPLHRLTQRMISISRPLVSRSLPKATEALRPRHCTTFRRRR